MTTNIKNHVIGTERMIDIEKSTKGSTSKCRRNNPDRKRFGARNHNKMQVLAKWISTNETFRNNIFGPKTMCTNDDGNNDGIVRILDVAGGKGELAARLCMCHGMNVTMVDPRPADILHVFNSIVLPKLPNKWQHSIEGKVQSNPNFIEETIATRFEQLVMYFDDNTTGTIFGRSIATIRRNGSIGKCNNNEGTEFANNVIALQHAIEKCDLIVGMHSDSATECIIDVALQLNKPFIVVPCCVFPNFFPDRYVAMPRNEEDNYSSLSILEIQSSGQPKVQVRNYDQFCEYLLQKDCRFRKEILLFEGRNVAIWWDGQ
jgi:hypothetical protein